jgi:hypothetical protein
MAELRAWDGKPSRYKDSEHWFKDFKRYAVVENGALVMENEVNVMVKYFQKVTVEVSYWIDKNDQQAVAKIAISERDW